MADASEPPPSDPLEAHWEERGRAAARSEHDAVCYPGAPASLNRYADWSQRRAVESLLGRVGPLRGVRALDVGCGTGRWSRLLAARGADVLGVDRSRSMVAEARRRSPALDVREMSVTRLELEHDTFDLAVAVTVVQHLDPDAQALAVAEIARVVRPGGFVLAVDRAGPPTRFSAEHGTFPRTPSGWEALWRAAGCELVASRGQEFSYPLALASLGRRVPAADVGRTTRRGGRGWRRHALGLLVAASYPVEILASRIPRARAAHVACLYRVG